MREEIYRSIVENSQISYIVVNCQRNCHDKYTSVRMVEYNSEFSRMLHLITKNNILNTDIIEAIINSWIRNTFTTDEFDKFVREVITLKHKRIKSNINIELKNKGLILDIYYEDNYFVVVCSYIYNLKESCNLRVLNWEKDLDGVYKKSYYTNSQLSKKNMNIIGKRDADVWSKNELEQLKKHEEEVISKNDVKTFFHVLTNKKGKKLYYETTLWPLLDINNNLIGVKGASIEIDDKLDYASFIEENTENLEEITRYFNTVFIVTDDKKATYINSSFENVFENSPDKLYEDFYEINNYLEEPGLSNSDIKYTKNLDIYDQGEKKLKLNNNKQKWIAYNMLTMRNSKGEILKRVISILDITERKRIQEKKNQSKLNFFVNLSHELRTPINVITSTIQLTKLNLDKIESEEKNKFYRYVDIVEDNSWRLLKLINNLLDSTKIEEGFFKFKPINSDIVSYIEDICDSVAEYAEFNKVKLIFDTNKEEDFVLFDPNIIERVLLNLLSNAVKFSEANGKIYINIFIKDDEISIIVKDEGIGIPEDKLDFIFKRFEQASNKEKVERQGSGIGLYLVNSLIKLHGGSIRVESELNKGSKFIVHIPRKVLKENKCERRNLIEDPNYINNIHDKIGIEFSNIK